MAAAPRLKEEKDARLSVKSHHVHRLTQSFGREDSALDPIPLSRWTDHVLLHHLEWLESFSKDGKSDVYFQRAVAITCDVEASAFQIIKNHWGDPRSQLYKIGLSVDDLELLRSITINDMWDNNRQYAKKKRNLYYTSYQIDLQNAAYMYLKRICVSLPRSTLPFTLLDHMCTGTVRFGFSSNQLVDLDRMDLWDNVKKELNPAQENHHSEWVVVSDQAHKSRIAAWVWLWNDAHPHHKRMMGIRATLQHFIQKRLQLSSSPPVSTAIVRYVLQSHGQKNAIRVQEPIGIMPIVLQKYGFVKLKVTYSDGSAGTDMVRYAAAV